MSEHKQISAHNRFEINRIFGRDKLDFRFDCANYSLSFVNLSGGMWLCISIWNCVLTIRCKWNSWAVLFRPYMLWFHQWFLAIETSFMDQSNNCRECGILNYWVFLVSVEHILLSVWKKCVLYFLFCTCILKIFQNKYMNVGNGTLPKWKSTIFIYIFPEKNCYLNKIVENIKNY